MYCDVKNKQQVVPVGYAWLLSAHQDSAQTGGSCQFQGFAVRTEEA